MFNSRKSGDDGWKVVFRSIWNYYYLVERERKRSFDSLQVISIRLIKQSGSVSWLGINQFISSLASNWIDRWKCSRRFETSRTDSLIETTLNWLALTWNSRPAHSSIFFRDEIAIRALWFLLNSHLVESSYRARLLYSKLIIQKSATKIICFFVGWTFCYLQSIYLRIYGPSRKSLSLELATVNSTAQ